MLDFGLPHRLRGAYLLLQRRAARFLAQYDVSGDQYFVLRVLDDEDRLTQQELARRCFTDPSSMTGMVDRMVKRDLVRREVHESDGRSRRVCLTEHGKALFDQCAQAIFPIRAELRDAVGGQDELDRTIDALDKVIRAIADHDCHESLPSRVDEDASLPR